MSWYNSILYLNTSLLYLTNATKVHIHGCANLQHTVSTNPMHLDDQNHPLSFQFTPSRPPQQTYKGGTKRLSEQALPLCSLLKLSDMKGRLPRGKRE